MVTMPARTWGKPAPEAAPEPVVLVSSRDAQPAPVVPAARRLAALAGGHGWAVRVTYALAEVPAQRGRAAYRLASVAVRLARGGSRGVAIWYSRSDGAWRYASGLVDLHQYGLRALTERLAQP